MALEILALPAFCVIGFEGSTDEGPEMVSALWRRANARYSEIARLVKAGPDGAPLRLWGLMSDFTRSFRPWEDGFTRGLYLAGAECVDEAEPPAGWTKWVAPAALYARFPVQGDAAAAFQSGLAALRAEGREMAGAAFDCSEPQKGCGWVYFPIRP